MLKQIFSHFNSKLKSKKDILENSVVASLNLITSISNLIDNYTTLENSLLSRKIILNFDDLWEIKNQNFSNTIFEYSNFENLFNTFLKETNNCTLNTISPNLRIPTVLETKTNLIEYYNFLSIKLEELNKDKQKKDIIFKA